MVEQTLPLFYSDNLEDSFLQSLLFEPQSAENLPPQLSLMFHLQLSSCLNMASCMKVTEWSLYGTVSTFVPVAI